MNEANYAFAVAKIRSLENKLVHYNQIERIIDSNDASSFYDALSDTAYAKHFSQEHDASKFQSVLNTELIQTKKALSLIAPDPKQLNWIWYKYDFLNLKYILKCHLANAEINKDILLDIGNFNPILFINYLEKQEKGSLDDKITRSIDQLINIYKQKNDPKIIDLKLDKLYLSYLSKECHRVESDLVKKLILEKIDLYNLKVIFRAKELNFSEKIVTDFLVNYGAISKEKFIKAFSEDINNITSNPTFRDYNYILKNSIEYFQKTKSFLVFEKLSHEHFIDSMRHAKYLAFGIEPLIAYWLAKDNEVKILRIIMTGKINNIEPKLIHQQIHKLYTQK